MVVHQGRGCGGEGHLRGAAGLTGDDAEVPVCYVDLDEAEERLILASFDPIGAMAAADTGQLEALLRDVQTDEPALQQLLADLGAAYLKLDAHAGNIASQTTIRDVATIANDPKAKGYEWVTLAVVDFSGGKDSSGALLWAKVNLPWARVVGLYVDLGVDFPGYVLHVLEVAKTIGVDLQVLRTERSLFEGLVEKGWPGWKGPWCQGWMHEVLARWVRANGSPSTTLRLTGTRAKQKKATSKLAPDAPLPSTPEFKALAPIFDWSEASVARALTEAGVPIWDGYARGLKRTACWVCPGQRPAVYGVLRREYPELFRGLERLEQVIGPCRFWEPTLLGKTMAEAADRGDQVRPSANVPEDEDGDAEFAEASAG
jgi:3'-phosphoadenosine 5'-phosphosulfate sulfotransferase (PAPS reductase)/FAD synthetase